MYLSLWVSMPGIDMSNSDRNSVINLFAVKWYGESEFWLSGGKVVLIAMIFSFTFITMVGGNPKHDAYGFRYWREPVSHSLFSKSLLSLSMICRVLLPNMSPRDHWGDLKDFLPHYGKPHLRLLDLVSQNCAKAALENSKGLKS